MRPEDFFILGLLLGGYIAYLTIKLMRRKRTKRRVAGAKRAERKAAELLTDNGYEILESQKFLPVTTIVDGKKYNNGIRVDYLVKRNNRTYVAEVKTGEDAINFTRAPVRRQLLEYYLAYQPDGVLLLDMEQNTIHEIEFLIHQPRWRQIKNMAGYLLAFLTGALLMWLVMQGGLK